MWYCLVLFFLLLFDSDCLVALFYVDIFSCLLVGAFFVLAYFSVCCVCGFCSYLLTFSFLTPRLTSLLCRVSTLRPFYVLWLVVMLCCYVYMICIAGYLFYFCGVCCRFVLIVSCVVSLVSVFMCVLTLLVFCICFSFILSLSF